MANIDTDGDKNFTFLTYEKERMDDFDGDVAGGGTRRARGRST